MYFYLTQSGFDIFSALSIICVLFTLSIPLLYIFRHRHQSYGALSQHEDSEVIENVQSERAVGVGVGEEEEMRLNVIFSLISFSYFVNISYFSLWVMEGFRREKDDQSQQFNKTLLISSAFFLIAAFFQFVAANSYIGCKLKEGVMGNDVGLGKFIRPFLIGYGLLILTVFTASRSMEWHYMVTPILLFGFHNVLVTHLTERI